MLTQTDMRWYDWETGRLRRIECGYHSGGVEVTAWMQLGTGGVVTGNERGEMAFYEGVDSSEASQVGHWHSSPVQHI